MHCHSFFHSQSINLPLKLSHYLPAYSPSHDSALSVIPLHHKNRGRKSVITLPPPSTSYILPQPQRSESNFIKSTENERGTQTKTLRTFLHSFLFFQRGGLHRFDIYVNNIVLFCVRTLRTRSSFANYRG